MNTLDSQPLLEVKNLSRCFGAKVVLDSVNLTLHKGEILWLQGANGSGKTTLLRILATLTKPDQGTYFAFGNNVEENLHITRQLLSWAPASDGGFVPKLTGLENLKLFSSLGQNPSQEFAQLKTMQDFTVLQKALKTPFQVCSSGMKQALHLARALIRESSVLLLDEPLQHLDQESVDFIESTIQKMKGSRSIIFSSHGETSLSELATRTAILNDKAIRTRGVS